MENTLTIIKPDSVAAGNSGKILAHLEEGGFEIRIETAAQCGRHVPHAVLELELLKASCRASDSARSARRRP